MVNTETIGELIDKLSIVNIKMSRWNHRKIELHNKKKLVPEEKDELISIDKQIMVTNEMRVALKNKINEFFGQTKEERTYEHK